MYNATYWLDRVVDEETEEVIQEGTDQSAGHFNNMEEGISDAHLATAILLISASLSADQVATEEQTITLENSESFPFNNSVETVEAEVLEHDGNVGDVKIFSRLLNGFKVAYDGSAKTATIKLRIKGGM